MRDELDVTNEKMRHLQKNGAIIEVYKKKVETMAELRQDLEDAKEENQKLYAEVKILMKDKERCTKLEECISQLTGELSI